MLPFLRRYGPEQRLDGDENLEGDALVHLPCGGAFTFEPGGQIEYSSPPCSTPSELLDLLRRSILPLRAASEDEGITLLTTGIDPANPIEARRSCSAASDTAGWRSTSRGWGRSAPG